MTTPSSDVLVRHLRKMAESNEVRDVREWQDNATYIIVPRDSLLVAAEKIETLEGHLSALREQRGAREQVLERRIRDLEEAFSRVSDEGDALNAEKEGYEHDLVVAAEEHAKTLAELDAATTRHEADHQSVIDLMDDLTRAREEAGEARRLLRNLYIYVASQASNSHVPHPNTILAARQASDFLSVSTSTETSPAECGACRYAGWSQYECTHGLRLVATETSPARERHDCSRDHPECDVWHPPAPENAPQGGTMSAHRCEFCEAVSRALLVWGRKPTDENAEREAAKELTWALVKHRENAPQEET